MHINYLDCVKKNNMGRAGLLLLIIISSLAIFGPYFISHSPGETSTRTLQPPSANHLLGTNDIGQDIFARLVFGARTSVLVSFAVGILATLMGTLLGATAALFGGIYERVLMRMIDIFLIIPEIIIIILISAYVRPNIFVMILLLSLFRWQGSARIIRAQTLSLKKRAHIAAARGFGASGFYILKRHIVPDLGPIMAAGFIQHARRAVFMEASLAFLGIADPSMVSWGLMLKRALEFSYLEVWHWMLSPGIMLSLTVMSFTFLGYALEETLNPRLRVRKNA